MSLKTICEGYNDLLPLARELALDISFVRLRAPNRALTLKCPLCGLIMLEIPNKDEYDYVCPECGIVAR